MSLRAATVRGLVRSPSAGVFSGADDQWNPRMLPNLAAWFDALDVSTMLSGDGTTITDGGAVALWGDKSGNSGVNCLVLSGASGNNATVPSSAALNASTELELISRVALVSYATGANQNLIAKTDNLTNNGYLFGPTATGAIRLAISPDGTVGAFVVATSSATLGSVGVTAFQSIWIKVTWRASDGLTQFFYATDQSTEPASWTQLGTDQTLAAASIYAGTSDLRIGGYTQSAELPNGLYRRAIVRSAIGGAKQLDIDFSTAGKKLANGDTFVCATGQTVTLNSSGATGARIAGERDLYQGTAANRPVWLNYAGTKYGYLNAVSGNYFSSPESTVLDGATELQITALISPNVLGVNSVIWAKAQGAEYTGYFIIDSNNDLSLTLSTDGTAGGRVTVTKTPNVALSVGTQRYVRATWRASDGRVQIFDGATIAGLTQAGTNGTITMANLYNSTVPFEVGSRAAGTANPAGARIYSCEVCATIGGAAVQSFNPALYSSGTTFTASTGEVWTINGGAHIVTRTGLYFDGSNDYLKTAAFSLSQPETVYLAGEQVTWASNDKIYDGNSTNERMALLQYTGGASPQIGMFAGTTAGPYTNWAVRAVASIIALFNGVSGAFRVNRGAAQAASTNTQNGNGITLGAALDGTAPANIFVSEVAIYSAAHNTATQDRWAIYAGRRHGFAV